ncbi:MAG: M18 family aminopeptidase, partial [Propionibacteriaceae bacterium]|nr:M18 family aminopeptidase [Propionibacteriaceae bacterium]
MTLAPADYLPGFADYLDAAPTPYHAAAVAGQRLASAGFKLWRPGQLAPVPAGYAVREGAFAAWRAPSGWRPRDGLRIVVVHTDSPGLKLKPDPVLSNPGGYAQLGVEVYGAPALDSWLDRELVVAGRVGRSGAGPVGGQRLGQPGRI